jgi:hypothetical protein
MATAEELRAEAKHWRELSLHTLDERTRAILEEMISELDERAATLEAAEAQDDRPEG